MEPLTEVMNSLVALPTIINKDTMYCHQAMCEDDVPQFINIIINEINNHVQKEALKKDHPRGQGTQRAQDSSIRLVDDSI